MIITYILFMFALANLISIAVMTYLRKQNWAMSLSIVEIIIVYLALTIGN